MNNRGNHDVKFNLCTIDAMLKKLKKLHEMKFAEK